MKFLFNYFSSNIELLNTLIFIITALLIIYSNIANKIFILDINTALLLSKRSLELEESELNSVSKRSKIGDWTKETYEEETHFDPILEEQIPIQLEIGNISEKLNSNELTPLEEEIFLKELINNVILYQEKNGDIHQLDIFSLISNLDHFNLIKKEVKKHTGVELLDKELEFSEEDKNSQESDSEDSDSKKNNGGNTTSGSNFSNYNESSNNNNESGINNSNFTIIEKGLITLLLLFSRFMEFCEEIIMLYFNNF